MPEPIEFTQFKPSGFFYFDKIEKYFSKKVLQVFQTFDIIILYSGTGKKSERNV